MAQIKLIHSWIDGKQHSKCENTDKFALTIVFTIIIFIVRYRI